MKKYVSTIYISLIFAILYIPILTVILFSFNATESTATFSGFSFYWYIELFKSDEAWIALRNTLILAVLSALISTVIGTAAAEGIYKMRSKLIKNAVTSVTNIPMLNPDIVTGMSMMLFFAAVMAIFNIADYNDIGFAAMLISHTTFCLPYVILSVLPRITELGNTLDDFVISYFVGPTDFQTLPLLIYSMTKKTVKPDMYALSTIIIISVFILLFISNMRSLKKSAVTPKKRKGVKKGA